MSREIIQTISIDSMMKDVNEIARWERLAGSREEGEAFRYLEQRLDEMGYETKMYRHDAWISIPISSRFLVEGEEIRSQTHAMSRDTAGVMIRGSLIYLENLLTAPPDLDCQETVILTKGRAVYDTVHRAEELGAIAVVFMQESPIRECIPSAAWGSPTPYGRALLPGIPVLSIREEDGQSLVERVKKGKLTADVETELDTGWRKIPLLTGEIKAAAGSDLFVMFSGHVDSWYFGAIDNGTANAVQLEAARLIAGQKNKLQRNFRVVFFSGHSQGRYAGSAWYADHQWEDIHRHCAVNINADSLGGRGACDITRSIIMPETKGLAVQIIREQTGIDFVGSRCRRVADQSFWNAGVSSAFASFSKQARLQNPDGTWGYPKGNAELGYWWHTPKDTVDNVDPANLVRDAGIFVEYVNQFLIRPLLPLDFTMTAEEIERELKVWGDKLKEKRAFGKLIELASQLVFESRKFYASEFADGQKNRIMIELGRILVPLNYTTGDPYEPDPALLMPPIPSLAVIDKMAVLESDCDEYKSWGIVLTRKMNYVADSLQKALCLLREGIGGE